nr:RNA-directed DNA polymerase, eukaryota [Tanacetum cinerariifolium]
LWPSLSRLISNWDGNIIVTGDFNEVREARKGTILEKAMPDHRPILLKESVVNYGNATRDYLNFQGSSMKILGDIKRKEASDLAQKAKIKWAIKGDENSNFFHGSLNKMWRQIAIKGGARPSLGDMSFIQIEQREFFEHDVFNEEIKRDVWDCRCNYSFIALIPKVGNAKFVLEFRPISLIGFQYKIVGKLLANMHSTVTGSHVSVSQSAFIKGRNILDGPLILNECMAWYRKRKKDLMVFKVDFEKAFDSLRWDYLDVVMENLGFRYKWRTWISGYLNNFRASILVNGTPTAEFEMFKGLRQGDLLSLFLFILAMEGFHATICKAVSRGVFKGALIGQGNLIVSHLFYANDATFIGVSVPDVDVADMAKILGYGVSKFPMMYLGVPIVCNMG